MVRRDAPQLRGSQEPAERVNSQAHGAAMTQLTAAAARPRSFAKDADVAAVICVTRFASVGSLQPRQPPTMPLGFPSRAARQLPGSNGSAVRPCVSGLPVGSPTGAALALQPTESTRASGQVEPGKVQRRPLTTKAPAGRRSPACVQHDTTTSAPHHGSPCATVAVAPLSPLPAAQSTATANITTPGTAAEGATHRRGPRTRTRRRRR